MIYLMGSLRNPRVPVIANALREFNHEVFDDWHAVGPEADDYWQKYETARGRTYKEALAGEAAKNVYNFDYRNLERATIGILLMPAGRSAHIELGFLKGRGKPVFVVFEEVPERYDVMYQFCDELFFSLEDFFGACMSGGALYKVLREAKL